MQLPLQETLINKLNVEKWGQQERESKKQYLQ